MYENYWLSPRFTLTTLGTNTPVCFNTPDNGGQLAPCTADSVSTFRTLFTWDGSKGYLGPSSPYLIAGNEDSWVVSWVDGALTLVAYVDPSAPTWTYSDPGLEDFLSKAMPFTMNCGPTSHDPPGEKPQPPGCPPQADCNCYSKFQQYFLQYLMQLFRFG